MTVMSKSRSAQTVNFAAAIIVVVALVVAIGAIALLNNVEGPASDCEDAGGHFLVGPGGETACVDRRTFLPIIEFERR